MEGDESKGAATILMVDDDAAGRQFLDMRLSAWDYRVVTAADGREGIAALEDACPDLVITDLYMPVADGFELLAYIERTVPDLPVIVMSGQGELEDAIRAMRLGAWDYITKPVNQGALLKMAIEKALEKARLIRENRQYRKHLEELVDRKRAQLRASEKRYRTVADFAYDWEYWINQAGRLEYMSPSCERITGISAAQFTRRPSLLQEILHADDREAFEQHLASCAVGGGDGQLDFRIVRADGRVRWICHVCQEVVDDNGRSLGRRCNNRDITYRKEIENDLIRQRHELLNKTIYLEKANHKLAETNQALKAMLDHREIEKRSVEQAMVANLKRFIFPYLDELAVLNVPKAAQTYLGIIRSNIDQLISPVSQTLNGAYLQLTPTEMKVADFIRQGESTKSIAALMNLSPSTVAIHRNNIRKKLDLLNKKVNLRSYLNSLI